MKIRILPVMALALICTFCKAQDDNAGTYMDKVNKPLRDVNQKYMSYISASSHGSIRKADRKRQLMMEQIDKSELAISQLPYYKGDKDLQQSAMAYLKLTADMQNENYSKIVNLEEISEQSYDNMEAYILLKKKVAEKMNEASEVQYKSQEDFAAKNNITLIKNESEASQNMKKMGAVMDYQEKMYLLFFKCNSQEASMMKAIEKKDVTAMEQLKNAMVKYANEGLEVLDTTKSFEGDASLKNACKKALEFFKKEGDKTSITTDYLMKTEAFGQIKKSFESNPSAKNDKNEIAKYNKAVNEMNTAVNTSNQNSQYLNQARTEAYDKWNNTQKSFLDTHVPFVN